MIEMARTRMKGKGITFTYDGVAYQCDLTSVVLEKSAGDTATSDGTLTFCDVGTSAADGDVWKMVITALGHGLHTRKGTPRSYLGLSKDRWRDGVCLPHTAMKTQLKTNHTSQAPCL